jgi:hypothetical protein
VGFFIYLVLLSLLKKNMFGDLILYLKKVLKQQSCIHNYKIVFRKDFQGGSFFECTKCEKLKEN